MQAACPCCQPCIPGWWQIPGIFPESADGGGSVSRLRQAAGCPVQSADRWAIFCGWPAAGCLAQPADRHSSRLSSIRPPFSSRSYRSCPWMTCVWSFVNQWVFSSGQLPDFRVRHVQYCSLCKPVLRIFNYIFKYNQPQYTHMYLYG